LDKYLGSYYNVPMEKSKVFFKNNSMRIKEIVASADTASVS
jgi:hypothetical protein